MLVMPIDDVTLGPTNASCNHIVQMVAEDLISSNAKLAELVNDVEKLLVAVDIAISQSALQDDSDWDTMRRCWCFLGPGLFKRVEALKELAVRPRLSESSRKAACAVVALVQTVLTIRRQTLELNNIEVLK